MADKYNIRISISGVSSQLGYGCITEYEYFTKDHDPVTTPPTIKDQIVIQTNVSKGIWDDEIDALLLDYDAEILDLATRTYTAVKDGGAYIDEPYKSTNTLVLYKGPNPNLPNRYIITLSIINTKAD